jgi:cobalt-zinc-cadmium efflux system outer membrane protein
LIPALRGRRCLLLALFTAAPAVALSRDPDAPLRWADVTSRASGLPAVREAEARAEAAAGTVSSAGAIPNPAVTVAGGEAEARDGSARRQEWGIAVELPLESLATRGARVDAARASERAATMDAQVARAMALRAIRRDFVALGHAQAQLEAQTEIEAQTARLAGLVRRRSERGEARPTEVPRVEIEVERLRFAVHRTRAGFEALRRRLATTLGVQVGRVEVDLERTPDLPALDELLSRLADATPAVLAARARVGAASEDLSAERRERVPKLSLGAGHVEELDRRATSVTATISFPLWNWNGGKIRQAEAHVTAEQARLDAALRETSAATSDAWSACAAGRAGASRFREEVLPRAESAARMMGRAFELGEANLLEVIDSRRVLLDTRREYLDLLLDMQNACGDLAALTGLELP